MKMAARGKKKHKGQAKNATLVVCNSWPENCLAWHGGVALACPPRFLFSNAQS